MAIYQRSELSETEQDKNSVDHLFETLKNITEQKQKADEAKLEHLDNINKFNLENLSKYIQSEGGMESKLDERGQMVPWDYSEHMQAINQKKAFEETKKQQRQELMDLANTSGGNFVPSIDAKGNLVLRGTDPEVEEYRKERVETMKANTQLRAETMYTNRMNQALQSSRGTIGRENIKVNGAIHARTILDQAYDEKTGKFNLSPSAHTDLAMNLATIIGAGNPQISERLTQELKQTSASEMMKKASIYMGADPQKIGGTTQSIAKMFRDMLDRQGTIAEENRDAALEGLSKLRPSYLKPDKANEIKRGIFDSTLSYKKHLAKSPDQMKQFASPEEADKSGLPKGTIVRIQGRRYQI